MDRNIIQWCIDELHINLEKIFLDANWTVHNLVLEDMALKAVCTNPSIFNFCTVLTFAAELWNLDTTWAGFLSLKPFCIFFALYRLKILIHLRFRFNLVYSLKILKIYSKKRWAVDAVQFRKKRIFGLYFDLVFFGS